MFWNYRVVEAVYDEESVFCIHEIHYHDNGKIQGWTKDPVYIQGDSLEELKIAYEMYGKAFDKPVLSFDDNYRLVEKP